MNGEHLQDLRSAYTGGRSETNEAQDELQAYLGDAWAVGMVLAAYDHELFYPHCPGDEQAWSATLAALLGARSRILSEIIPARLRTYRSWTVEKEAGQWAS